MVPPLVAYDLFGMEGALVAVAVEAIVAWGLVYVFRFVLPKVLAGMVRANIDATIDEVNADDG